VRNLNRIKEKDLKNQLRQLSTLYRITHELNSSLDLNRCLQKIIKEVAKLLNVTRVSLMLLDEQSKELTIKCAVGIDKEVVKNTRIKLKDSSNISSWVAQSGKPLLVSDIQRLKRFTKWNSGAYFNSSLLSVPLKRRKRILGVLNVNNKNDGSSFNRDDLDFLSMLTGEFSLAIDNAQLYQKLIQTNKDLKKLYQTKTDFMDDISHNLRNPLSAVQYAVDIIKNERAGKINTQQRHLLSMIDSNLNYINRLINRILELSRLQSGRVELKKEDIYIAKLIKEVADSFKPLIKDKGIILRRKIRDRNIQIFADPDRIRDLLINLIDNAIRFTPTGGRITIEMVKLVDFIKISVIDTGIGISKQEMKRLFTRFYLGKSGDSAKGTFGLGLAISKSIVEMHGGNIYVESKKGKGAKFTFTLPC